jgi:hypothetical protein
VFAILLACRAVSQNVLLGLALIFDFDSALEPLPALEALLCFFLLEDRILFQVFVVLKIRRLTPTIKQATIIRPSSSREEIRHRCLIRTHLVFHKG